MNTQIIAMKFISRVLFVVLFFAIQSPLKADHEVGKNLYTMHCKACHNMDMRLVGPALKDVEKRHSKEWLHQFIKSSTTMINAGDSAAVALFSEYNQVLMPDQNLSSAEIDSILAYIAFESLPKTKGKAGDILRPEQVATSSIQQPLQFSHYSFWIPYTLTIILFIGSLYAVVEWKNLLRETREKSASE